MTWFLLASGSALLSAAAAIAQKKVLLRTHALEFSFLVSVIIMLLSFCFPMPDNALAITGETLFVILGKSVVGGVAFLLVMMSLERDQMSRVLPLLGLTPALTACVSFLVTGELLHAWEWVGIGLVVIGAYFLEKRPGGERALTPDRVRLTPGHYYIVTALLLFAISSVVDKKLMSGYKTDPRVVLVYQHVVYCVVFGLLLAFRRVSLRSVMERGREQYPFLIAIALLTVAYRYAQLEATKDAPVALVLAVKRTSILYASFFGGRLFSEDRLGIRLAGAALIVASGFVILRNVV
jgi:drug/metabolite transporter (DMT)-like permease